MTRASTHAEPSCPQGPGDEELNSVPRGARCRVFTLTRCTRRAFDWFRDGIAERKALPADTKLNANQEIHVRAVRTCRPHVDGDALLQFLDGLEYPLHFLDFETVNPAQSAQPSIVGEPRCPPRRPSRSRQRSPKIP